MRDPPKIASLFPNLLKIPRPITDGSSPLIISGNLLHINEVQMLPIVSGLQPRVNEDTKTRMYATLGGYSVLQKILKTRPEDYLKLLWTPCQEMPVWIGSVKYTDTFDDLLKVFDATKFGDAAVEGSGSFPALITLQEILVLYRNDKIKSRLRASECGSEMVSISENSRLLDALELMFQRRIRRLFLSPKMSDAVLRYISTRSIIRFLFSPERLEIAKKTPDLWLDAKLSDVEASKAKTILDGKTVNQASREIGDPVDDCLVLEKSKKVVSRWDIVMKPWKSGDYSFED